MVAALALSSLTWPCEQVCWARYDSASNIATSASQSARQQAWRTQPNARQTGQQSVRRTPSAVAAGLGGSRLQRKLFAPRAASTPGIRSFAVLGDAGQRRGVREAVGRTLSHRYRWKPFASVVVLGDNAYSRDAFSDSIAKPYRSLLSNQVRFFPVLGNHDVKHGRSVGAAELSYWGTKRPYYHVALAPELELFAIDTTLFMVDSDRVYGPGVTKLRAQELRWLDHALARSTAKYKVVYGHHAMYSSVRNGDPQQTLRLREAVEPILEAHGVKLYLAGHYHYYERTAPIHGITHITSGGAGSNLIVPDQPNDHRQEVAASKHHFMLFELGKRGLSFKSLTKGGKLLDKGTL